MKKKLLLLTGLIVPAAPIAAVVSCSSSSTSGDASSLLSKLDYDFGLACQPINNLNYLRNNLGQVQDTLVFPLIQQGPTGTLKNILQMPELKMYSAEEENNGNIKVGTRFYTLSSFGEYPGGLSPVDKSYLYVLDKAGSLQSIHMRLNEKINWKGSKDASFDRPITAQDYVDGIKYIMDLNNGSQLTTRLLTTGIIGINEIYNAQVDYVQAMGRTYSDPWGFNIDEKGLNFKNENTHLKLETTSPTDQAKEAKYVARIEQAARTLLANGIMPAENTIQGRTADEFDLKINFDSAAGVSEMDFDSYYSKYLVPANREFIEHIGGIYKFGTSEENFLYSSPFNITDIRLGQGGYIDLAKDQSFYSAKYTLSNKIKIYFQEDPNILSSMFKDGYISATMVSPTYLERFWSEPSLRQYMTKSQGFGTVAIRFNLNKANQEAYTTQTKLDNPDLRLAISYAIDRNQYIKLAGWDSAAITSLWNVKGTQFTSDGRAMDTFFDNQQYQDILATDKNIDLTSMSYNERTAIMYKFEHARREDARHNEALAKAHLDKYLNGKSSVKLTFLCSGDQGVKQGLGLKSQFDQIFGGKIDLEIKSVPKSSYDNMITHGQFDMAVDNFDKFGMTADAYYKALIWSDEIDPSLNKTSGFLNNPSGSWTFARFYNRIKNQNGGQDFAKYKQAIGVLDANGQEVVDYKDAWEIFEQIADASSTFSVSNQQAVNSIFAKTDADVLGKLYVIFEKIIALDAPVVPLYEVDTKWDVSRLQGIQNLYSFDLQFAYDILKRPGDNLPGLEIK